MNVNPLAQWWIEYDAEVGITYLLHAPCKDGYCIDDCSLEDAMERVRVHTCSVGS